MKEMIEYGMPLAESGNAEMQGRIGRAYRDGKGVEKDLAKASEWMKKAADQKLWWVGPEMKQLLDSMRMV